MQAYPKRSKRNVFVAIITLHTAKFTFILQMLTQMRAVELHLTLAMNTVDLSMFTHLRMSLHQNKIMK